MTTCSCVRGWPARSTGRVFKVVGQAADTTEVLSLVSEHRPDLVVVVVDIYS
jgi:AmiR/NasT family two-component response regulator